MKIEFSFFFVHSGLFFVIVGLVLAAVQKTQALFLAKKYPELKEIHDKLILGYMLFMGIPFLIMEVGTLATNIPGLFLLFKLHEGNPFTLAFFICLLLEYVFLLNWVWFRDGAEILHKSNLLFVSFNHRSPKGIKIAVTLMVAGGLFAIVMLWTMSETLGSLTPP